MWTMSDRPVRPSRPTLEVVAAAARVSRQTVSNALNAPHLVRAETLERVCSAIDALGYRPLHAARALRTGRSRVIGMRLEPARDGMNGSVLDRFLHALVERGQDDGYRVQLFTAEDDVAEVRTYDELWRTAGLDGLVVTGTHFGDPRTAWLRERAIPFVTFGRPWGEDTPAHAWVDVDGAGGTQTAVAHLVARGHRRVAFLGWPAGSGVGDDRRAGWQRGVAEAGLAASGTNGFALELPDSVEAGQQAMLGLLERTDRPTAVVCASDSLALGALGALRTLGLVGSDDAPPATVGPKGPHVAVVGFDDTPVAAAVGLSSVSQPLREAARACMELLLGKLSGDRNTTGPAAPATRLLPPRLVVRRTS